MSADITLQDRIKKVAELFNGKNVWHLGQFAGMGLVVEIVDNAVMVSYDTPWHSALIGSKTPGQRIFEKMQPILEARGLSYTSVDIDTTIVTFYC